MKIVDVSEFYSDTGGGVRIYVRQKLQAAARHGHQLTIIAPGAMNRVEERQGGKICWVKCPGLPFDRNYHQFWSAGDVWRVLDSESPDIVEGSSPWRGGWIAGHWPGPAARVLVCHQDVVTAYPHTFLGKVLKGSTIDRMFAPYWAYLRRLSARFDASITSGIWLARRLESFGVHRVTAIPFGIESGRFSAAKRDEGVRRKLLAQCGLAAGGDLLLAVGRMHPEKRYHTIINAFARAKTQRPLGLVIVGDGLRRKAVERHAKRVGNIHLTGTIEDRELLAAYYASADALVHGCAGETFGLAVAEAIASGLRVVVPDRGGAADLAPNGVYRLYKAGDARSCAAAILEVLDQKPGNPAPSKIGSLDEHFANLFGFYQRLIAAKASR